MSVQRKRRNPTIRRSDESVPVNYRYAFNTPEEVAALKNYYTGLIYNSSDSDEIIKYADRIKFLELQLTMTRDPRF